MVEKKINGINIKYVVQQWPDQPYADLFKIALQNGKYNQMFAAVAYATVGGVRVLEKTLREELDTNSWNTMSKQWLVGIDWCRSDPRALAQLGAFKRSHVKIPNGLQIVSRLGCLPKKTYHPKLYIFQGKDTSAIICGSGNLSANGLTKGCECGSLLLSRSSGNQELNKLLSWFRTTWKDADPYCDLMATYVNRCKESFKKTNIFVPTDDDVTPETFNNRVQKKLLSELQIRQL